MKRAGNDGIAKSEGLAPLSSALRTSEKWVTIENVHLTKLFRVPSLPDQFTTCMSAPPDQPVDAL